MKQAARGDGAEQCHGIVGRIRRWLARREPPSRSTRTAAAEAKLETWRQEGAAAFSKHHRERVVISDRAASGWDRRCGRPAPLAAERVWDLARGRDGSVFAATGDSGKVFRQRTTGRAAWTVVLRRGRHPGPLPGRHVRRQGLRRHRAQRAGRSR